MNWHWCDKNKKRTRKRSQDWKYDVGTIKFVKYCTISQYEKGNFVIREECKAAAAAHYFASPRLCPGKQGGRLEDRGSGWCRGWTMHNNRPKVGVMGQYCKILRQAEKIEGPPRPSKLKKKSIINQCAFFTFN